MPESNPSVRQRLPVIDAARGVALAAMVVYHFAWDLAYHGFVDWPVAEPGGWRVFAMSIAAAFLFLSGVSLALSARGGVDLAAHAVRLAKIAAAAGLVSLATWWLFPESWVFFGILHMIAAAGVLALPFLRRPWWLALLAAALALVLPRVVSGGVFDAPALAFLGLGSDVPLSNDFVPVLPWLAPALAGVAAGRLVAEGTLPLPARPLATPAARGLAVAGRWTLPIYLLHQPLLFGAVAAAALLAPPDPAAERLGFVSACEEECAADRATCAAYCGCVAAALDGTPFFSTRGGDPELGTLVASAVRSCTPSDAPPP